MFRYKIRDAQLAKVKKYLRTKSGRLQMPNWGIKFEKDLTLKGTKVYYKDKEIVPQDRVEPYLRARIFSKNADIATARDSAFYQLKDQCVGVSRRDIMAFLRKQRTIGSTRAALRQPKVRGGPKLKRHTFETDLVFIKKADLVEANPRFSSKHDLDICYCSTTCDKATGLVRLAYSETKRSPVITKIVKEQIIDLCKTLGLKPSEINLQSDAGSEYNKKELSKLVNEYKFVGMGPSVENKQKLFQRNFYRILKNRQAISVPVAIKKAQNLMNSSYNRIQKKSPNEAAEEQKTNKSDTLKAYNNKRKTHVSNTQLKELNVGDHVRVMLKSLKDSTIGFKSYKDKTFTKEVYEIELKTKKKPYKYMIRQDGKKKWYLIDKLLKSAVRDNATAVRLKVRSDMQEQKDKAEEAKEKIRIEKEIAENRKRIQKLKEQGHITPSITKGIANLKRIRNLNRKSGKVKKLLDEMQKEYERKMNKKGVKLSEKKIKIFRQKEKDDDYVPEEEEESDVKPVKKQAGGRKTKKWYVQKYTALGNKVLKKQTKLDTLEGESLDRLIRDLQVDIQEGQRLAATIRAKNYKKIGLDLTFFDQ